MSNPYKGITRRKQYKDGKFPGGRKGVGLKGHNYSIPYEYTKLFRQLNKFVGERELLREEIIDSTKKFCDSLLVGLEINGRIFYRKGTTSTFVYSILEPLLVRIRLIQTNPQKMQQLFTYLEKHYGINAKSTSPRRFNRLAKINGITNSNESCL